MAPIPHRLVISGRQGQDWVVLDFRSATAARIVNPSETGIDPFSVHEVLGPCLIEGRLNGHPFSFESQGIVEFAGGAREDPPAA
jgi:hypothetical protein